MHDVLQRKKIGSYSKLLANYNSARKQQRKGSREEAGVKDNNMQLKMLETLSSQVNVLKASWRYNLRQDFKKERVANMLENTVLGIGPRHKERI